MVKSFGSSNAAGLSDLKSRLARRGSVSHRAAAAARAVPKEAGRLCRGAIAERDWGVFRLIGLIDTLASMTGTLQVESFNRCVDKLVDNFDAEAI
jgi:hypothetical protein